MEALDLIFAIVKIIVLFIGGWVIGSMPGYLKRIAEALEGGRDMDVTIKKLTIQEAANGQTTGRVSQ